MSDPVSPTPAPPPTQLSLAGADVALLSPRPGEGPGLSELDTLSVAEHAAVFAAVHERLQRELASIDAL